MPTQTGFWIQVKNGEVKQVWDYKPDASRMAAESGWRAASEVKPDLVDNREIMTTHSFDLDADPAQIVWAKRPRTSRGRARYGVCVATCWRCGAQGLCRRSPSTSG